MQKISQKSNFLHKIDLLLQEALPNNLKHNFRVANLQATQLILYTTKASHLVGLRFCQPQVLAKLQEALPWLTGLEVKVRPAQMLVVEPVYKEVQISPTSQANLANLAKQISNPKLKQALLNLAQKKTASN